MAAVFNIFTVYSLVSLLLPCLIYQLVLIYQGKKTGKGYRAVTVIWTYIFLIYVWMVFEVTGIGLLADVLRTDKALISGGLNLVPFQDLGIGYVLNIIMCMPLGFLLPLIWRNMRSFARTACVGACFSLMIEITQLFNWRSFDVDDLTANIMGTMAGYLIWKIFVKIFGEHLKTDTVEIDDLEVVMSTGEIRLPKHYIQGTAPAYLLLALMGEFLFFNPYLLF